MNTPYVISASNRVWTDELRKEFSAKLLKNPHTISTNNVASTVEAKKLARARRSGSMDPSSSDDTRGTGVRYVVTVNPSTKSADVPILDIATRQDTSSTVVEKQGLLAFISTRE